MNQRQLILNPTDVAQWHALINEAIAKRAVMLPEELESYLVFLLMRFSQEPQMTSNMVGVEYLISHQVQGQQRVDGLRRVGDQCLILSGLFPGQAERRLVNVSYFIEIGRSAFHSLSNLEEAQSELYQLICREFVMMMDVLQATRQLSISSLLLELDERKKH